MTPTATFNETDLPMLTADLPGIGGAIKKFNEDFVVEELPLYPASGNGTHVYLTIEKQGLTTHAAIQLVARELGKMPRDIGYAGLKDAHGITRQTLSVEHVDNSKVAGLQLPRIKVLSLTRHGNKLKLGHLAGNRFQIKVRDVVGGLGPIVEAILERLRQVGVPNYFGPQRFGARGDNAAVGLAMVRGDFDEAVALMLGRTTDKDHGAVRRARDLFDAGDLEAAAEAWPTGVFSQQKRLCRAMIKERGRAAKAFRAVDPTLQKLLVSALQSRLFNEVLARRIGGLADIVVGDIAWKHANGACFRVEDPAAEQLRCTAFEISPTGPLFGKRMTEASGHPGEVEADVLRGVSLNKDEIDLRGSGKISGGRRPLRVPLGEVACESGTDERGPFVELRFSLPAGAYATGVLREVCKAPTPSSADLTLVPDRE
jgi:tRNA pseudouridine13 synthase